MHSITICFGPQGTIWNFLFKTEEAAKNAMEKIGEKCLIADDFGQAANIQPTQIHGMMLEDLDLSQAGQIERGLHNARSQAKAQQRAMSDATIRTAAMAQGPAVLSGGMPPRFNG